MKNDVGMSWKMVKLDNVCTMLSGNAWSASKFKDEGIIPIIRIQNLGNNENEKFIWWNDDYDKKFVVKKGDLLLSLSGSIKIDTWKGIDALLNQRIVKLIPKNGIDPQWFYWQITNIILDIERMGKWALVNNVSITDLKDLEIPLPPLPIQKRIAEILDAADALKRKEQALLKKYDELAQAIFIDMFGDPVKNEKGWDLKPFGELFDSRLGKMLDAKKQNGNFKYKYLGNSNVQWFSFQLNNLAEMTFDEKELRTFELKFGDLLICEGGEVGRTAIWKNETENIYFQKAIHRARVKTNIINVEYTSRLFWFFAKFGGLDDFVTTSTISHLTGEKLKIVPIPVPPIILQKKFEKKISKLSEIINISPHETGETLFQTLIQKAFKGELVVE